MYHYFIIINLNVTQPPTIDNKWWATYIFHFSFVICKYYINVAACFQVLIACKKTCWIFYVLCDVSSGVLVLSWYVNYFSSLSRYLYDDDDEWTSVCVLFSWNGHSCGEKTRLMRYAMQHFYHTAITEKKVHVCKNKRRSFKCTTKW